VESLCAYDFTLPVTFRLPEDTVKVDAVSADKQ
jgi:hypothetical protein